MEVFIITIISECLFRNTSESLLFRNASESLLFRNINFPGVTKTESSARPVIFFYYLLYFSHSYRKLHRTSYMFSVNK